MKWTDISNFRWRYFEDFKQTFMNVINMIHNNPWSLLTKQISTFHKTAYSASKNKFPKESHKVCDLLTKKTQISRHFRFQVFPKIFPKPNTSTKQSHV